MTIQEAVKKVTVRTQKDIPIETIIALTNQGYSHTGIARLLKCDRTNISARLKQTGYSRQRMESYERNRVDFLQFLQTKILNSISDRDFEKASLLQKTTAFCQLYDKERLERGLSTDNINVAELRLSLDDIRAEKAKIVERLKTLRPDPTNHDNVT